MVRVKEKVGLSKGWGWRRRKFIGKCALGGRKRGARVGVLESEMGEEGQGKGVERVFFLEEGRGNSRCST